VQMHLALLVQNEDGLPGLVDEEGLTQCLDRHEALVIGNEDGQLGNADDG
jgi:hypothetical protein